MPETNSRTVHAAKRALYVVGAVNVVGATVGLLAPPQFVASPNSPIVYLFGELQLEGQFILLSSHIAFYAAIIHTARTGRVGTATLCACTVFSVFSSLFFPQAVPTLLTFPVLNINGIILLPDALSMPPGGLLVVAVIIWNVAVLRADSRGEQTSSEFPDSRSGSLLSRSVRWRIVSRISAYTLVGAYLLSPVVRNPPPYLWRAVLPFLAVATYTFVSTDSVRGTAGLATGAWIIGLATLQYDTALTGIAFPTATLLTISATAIWLSGRTHETRREVQRDEEYNARS